MLAAFGGFWCFSSDCYLKPYTMRIAVLPPFVHLLYLHLVSLSMGIPARFKCSVNGEVTALNRESGSPVANV